MRRVFAPYGVDRNHNGEAIVFHNHPMNLLNVLFDNSPLPSDTDRDTMIRSIVEPVRAIKAITGGGSIRFYVGENGFVQEFRMPSLRKILKHLRSG